MKINYDEAIEIADIITGVENPDEDLFITEDALVEKFGISIDDFHLLLLKITEILEIRISPLTKQIFMGYANKELGVFLYKEDVSNKFLNILKDWMLPVKEKGDKTYSRTITLNGKPEFEIIYKPIRDQTK